MKTSTYIWILIVVTCLCESSQAEWQNALQPKGKPAGQVKVVKAGKPAVTIRCPAQPTPQETKAAADLQQWIKEMTGATLTLTGTVTLR